MRADLGNMRTLANIAVSIAGGYLSIQVLSITLMMLGVNTLSIIVSATAASIIVALTVIAVRLLAPKQLSWREEYTRRITP